MLPNVNVCRAKIAAFKARVGTPYFAPFWAWKLDTELTGASILDPKHVGTTAEWVRRFLIGFGMAQTGIAPVSKITGLLDNLAPSYNSIKLAKLGSGKMYGFRKDIDAIYSGLDGVTNLVDFPDGRKSSITGKSKVLLAIWGETPGFDRLTRRRFLSWSYPPAPLYLPCLRRGKVWYTPQEFCDMIEELDRWVAAWPANNGGISFSSLSPGHPAGRIIDMIYNWEM
jgi:hypothetical protein